MQADAIFDAPARSRWNWAFEVLLLFLVSRLLLAGFLLWAQNALHDYPGATPLSIATRWDAYNYVDIARAGYIHSSNVTTTAFFPVFPALTRAAAVIVQSFEWAGLLVSNLCLFGAMLVIHRLVEDETGDRELARRTLLYLVIFPTSFFFAAAYTESTMILLGALTVWCSRRRQWGWAIFWCAIGSATRTVGVIYAGYIALEWARSHGWRLERIHRADAWRGLLNGLRTDWLVPLALPLGALGLLVFMRFTGDFYGDPFLFSNSQIYFGNGVHTPFGMFIRDLPYLLTATQQGMFERFQGGTNYALWFFALAALVPVWRRFGSELAIVSLLLIVISAMASNTSLSRYVLSAFPVFIGMAIWAKHPRADRVMTVVFVALQAGLLFEWLRGSFYA